MYKILIKERAFGKGKPKAHQDYYKYEIILIKSFF